MNHPSLDSESFGAFLKRERELREVPLQEIAAFTRIRRQYLEALEQDDFNCLPSLATIKGFIRCYAQYLELDTEQVMLRFEAFVREHHPELDRPLKPLPQTKESRKSFFIAGGVMLLLVAGLFTAWLLRSPADRQLPSPQPGKQLSTPDPDLKEELPETLSFLQSKKVLPEIPLEEPAGQEAAPSPGDDNSSPDSLSTQGKQEGAGEPPAPAETAKNDAADPAHSLVLKTRDRCWVKVYVDEQKPRMMILPPKGKLEIQARRSLRINLGNPDGVASVIYNGKPFNPRPWCKGPPWWLTFPKRPEGSPCPRKAAAHPLAQEEPLGQPEGEESP